MDLPSRTLQARPRAASSALDTFESLVTNPFSTQVSADSFYASLGTSIGGFLLVAAIFCLIRPYNNVVYAPRSKHADEKHAPPPVGKGIFDWVDPLVKTKEQALVDKVGLDAALFLRVTRMCRYIFTVITVIGCGVLIPLNLIVGNSSWATGITWFSKLTPSYIGGNAFWIYVALAYVFDLVICFFLLRNYRAVYRLRRAYFDSTDYQRSLHARTLMVTEIPKALRTDEGLVKITEEAKDVGETPRTAIARNVKELPDLIEEHEETVYELEEVLAKYLKNPDRLPAKRPTTKVHKADKAYRKGQNVDAIDYLTSRIRELELEIKEVRESVDKRNAMSYGFASYESIADAHTVAYATRSKAPHGTKIWLAPRPHDLIWKNLPKKSAERKWATFYNNIWVSVLTVAWVAPNALIAVFLSNLGNLALVWPAFRTSLEAHHGWWALVQGVAAPALTSLFYFFLPVIFRRLSTNSGDLTKTSRERHVTHKLYTFFVFNNLFLFSLFAALSSYIYAVINASKDSNGDVWDAVKEGHLFEKGVTTMISVSTYWATYLLQRNLGAAVDLSQLVNLAWGSFSRHFLSPTPRQLIKLSAPQPFDYAGYYNYFLFYSTVAICFATLQPLVLPITATYFWMDSYLKKYLLLYVFITKTESGGQFWRVLFNRFLFLAFLGNCIIALLVGAKGTWYMAVAVAPAVPMLLAFKWYCSTKYDKKMKYYSVKQTDLELEGSGKQKTKKHDRVGVRFGHPVLYKPLITPMVHAKSQHLLRQIYSGRVGDEEEFSVAGYSDIYMDPMAHGQAGKAARNPAPFELVTEGQMDFEHYKNRPEFRDELGGDGELYGRPQDLIRRGSGGTYTTDASSIAPGRGRSDSVDSDSTRIVEGQGTVYPAGYHQTPLMRSESPVSTRSLDIGYERRPSTSDDQHLLSGAARFGTGTAPLAPTPGGYGDLRRGLGEEAYTPGDMTDEEVTSYDYFRRGRRG